MADLTPGPYELVLLALAAARTWKLLADDKVLDRPRDWVLDRLDSDDDNPWEYFITCPWCAGAWVSLAWYTGWVAWPSGALALASLAAISALVGGLATWLERQQR
jgi:hypothetical protein